MMQKGFFLVFVLVLLVNPWEIRGLQADTSSSQSVSQLPTALSLLYNRVLVYRQKGGALTGLLVGVESDALIVRAGGKDEKIPFQNLAKVIIKTKKNIIGNAISGMLMGAYLGNLLFFSAENQPTAYMESFGEIDALWLEPGFVAAGILLGFLSSSAFEKGEKAFVFTNSDEKRHAEWERLIRFVTGNPIRRKLHLTIQAGLVFTRGTLMQDPDFIVDYGYGIYWEYGMGMANNFNLLRKLQITISPMSNAEIGIALYWLGEPFITGINYWPEDSSLAQIDNTRGYYAIAIYKPFLNRMPNRIVWNVGAGFGAAKIDFTLDSFSLYRPIMRSKYNISKVRFSSVVFTELNFYLRDDLSFGLTADYVFMPTENVHEIPGMSLTKQKIRLGNGSIGFTFGFHF